MQSLNDDERKAVLGEVLADELRVILEYVQEIPGIKQQLYDIDDRLTRVEGKVIVIETAIRAHEADIKFLRNAFA